MDTKQTWEERASGLMRQMSSDPEVIQKGIMIIGSIAVAYSKDAIQKAKLEVIANILADIDGYKEVYKEGDTPFDTEAEVGEEKSHIDSCCNELLDEVLTSLKSKYTV